MVITRDQRIRYRPVEKQKLSEHRVRAFVLTGRKSQETPDSLAVLEKHWPATEEIASTRPEGPWMHAVTDEQLREIPLA